MVFFGEWRGGSGTGVSPVKVGHDDDTHGHDAHATHDHGHGHGHSHGDEHSHSGSYPDLNQREVIIAIPLVILTVALGVLPTPFLLAWMSPSVDETVKAVLSAKTVIDPKKTNSTANFPIIAPNPLETVNR